MAYQALDQNEQCFHVVALRTTSEIKSCGTLQFIPEQAPLAVTDDYHGEMNRSSVRQESDLAPFKPRCDVIVNGKVLMKDRDFTGLDAEEVMAKVREISDKIRT